MLASSLGPYRSQHILSRFFHKPRLCFRAQSCLWKMALFNSSTPWGSVFPASPGFNMTHTLFALMRVNGLCILCWDQRLLVGWRSLHRHFPFSFTIISQNTSACRLVVTSPSRLWSSSLLLWSTFNEGRHECPAQTEDAVLDPAETRVKSLSQVLGDLKAEWGQTLLSLAVSTCQLSPSWNPVHG